MLYFKSFYNVIRIITKKRYVIEELIIVIIKGKIIFPRARFFSERFTREPVEILDDHCDFRVGRGHLHCLQQPEVEDTKNRGLAL